MNTNERLPGSKYNKRFAKANLSSDSKKTAYILAHILILSLTLPLFQNVKHPNRYNTPSTLLANFPVTINGTKNIRTEYKLCCYIHN